MLRHRAILFNTEYVYYQQRDRFRDVELQLNLQKPQTARYVSITRRNEMLLISRLYKSNSDELISCKHVSIVKVVRLFLEKETKSTYLS